MRSATKTTIALMAFMAGTAAQANEDDGTLSLAERQAALAERLNHIDDVIQWHGRYGVLRATCISGPTGLTALTQRWFDAAAQWVGHANQLLGTLAAAQDQLDDAEVQAAIREKLKEHQDGLFRLRHLEKAVQRRGAQIAVDLASLDVLPDRIVAGQEQTTAFMNARFLELKESVAKVLRHFDGSQQAAWENTLTPLAQTALAAIRRAMLAAPGLERSLAYVEQAIAADLELRPLVANIEQAHRDFQADVLNHRVFQAKRALDRLHADVSDALTRIATSTVDPRFRQDAIDAVERLRADAQSSWRHQTKLFPNYLLVARNIEKNKPSLIAECQDVATQGLRNCSLLRQISGLDAKHLRDFTDAQLEWVESSIERVRLGPLS